jgi:hypothetical protein
MFIPVVIGYIQATTLQVKTVMQKINGHISYTCVVSMTPRGTVQEEIPISGRTNGESASQTLRTVRQVIITSSTAHYMARLAHRQR